jgi:FdhD protein
MSQSTVEMPVARLLDGRDERASDLVAVEEPLEIRLQFERDGVLERRTVSITMRTPGDDAELAAGFLFTEGIIRDSAQIAEIRHCGATHHGDETNVIRLRLAPGSEVDLERLARNFYTTSSCGVCGKTSIDALRATTRYGLVGGGPRIDAAMVHRLPELQRGAQAAFACTGGLHASALFSSYGELISIREDVGRHNALDKVIGAELLAGRLPASDRILLVSGRASFELVQKAVMAGIPVLAAVGAPSSLAVELATEARMTLLGFVRDGRFNVYAGAERIQFDAP